MPVSYNFSLVDSFKARPYHLLCMTGFVLGIVALLQLIFDKGALDINMHDSYFVILHAHLSALLGIVLLVLWLMYLLGRKVLLSKTLTWLHVTFTILPVLGFLFAVQQEPSPYRNYSVTGNEPVFDGAKISTALVVCFALAQLMFVVNVLGGGIKRLIITEKTF